MYYYQHHIGDYRRDTSHLTLLEHGIYRQLLDLYYMTEKPLDANALRLISARTTDEMQAAKQILSEFFTLEDGLYYHDRCEDEIAKFHSKSEKASASAKARWNKNNKLEDANALQTQTKGNADAMLTNNHKPITNNHKPIKKTIVEETSPVSIVFEYWKNVMNHEKSILDNKRKKAISARLNDGYSVEQLKLAIVGCSKSEWHMGANDRNHVYDDIELICRTASNVDKFLQIAGNDEKLSSAGKSTKAALDRWLGKDND